MPCRPVALGMGAILGLASTQLIWSAELAPSPVSAAAQEQTQEQTQAPAAFDNSFLHRGSSQPSVDLSVFAFSNRVLPGLKSVSVRLNGQFLGVRDVDFVQVDDKEDAQPCLPVPFLEDIGVNMLAFPKLAQDKDVQCTKTLEFIASSSAAFDADKNVLTLSIPQAALVRQARGVVSPDLWDVGETAFWSSYRLSYNDMRSSGGRSNSSGHSSFLSLRNGFNLDAWRLRANGTFYDNDGSSKWDWSDFYAERDVAAWRGWLRLGDSSTSGNVFTSTRFRGVQLRSDEGMLPDSMRGYAPIVRGVAPSNAKVTVRQNGHVIYSTFVAAGPFVIDDLYSTPGAGDLEVEIEELGGRTTRFFQPFSALPAMMREGIWNYNFAVGQYRPTYGDAKPMLGQATLAYGLPFGFTAYGGWTSAADGYHAGAIGLALNMQSLGAVSVDTTNSRSRQRDGKTLVGTAARIQYAKSFPGSGTDFTLAGYRYNSTGYRSLEDAVRDRTEGDLFQGYQRQHEYQLSLSQRLGNVGSLSFNYYGIGYRNAPRKAEYMQMGFSSAIGRVGYSLNLGRNKSPWQDSQTTIMLTLSLPLGGTNTGSYAMNHSSGQGTSHDVNLNGALTDDYAATYALQTGVTSGGTDSGGHAYGSLGYASSIGQANLSHAYSRNNSSTNVDFSGALVVDRKGVLLGQSLGETAVVVDVPGAAGVQVDSYPGVRTDGSGRALIPYASPYRENRISLTPNHDDMTATIQENVQTVVPTRGAIVVAHFNTELGRTLLATLRGADGAEVPFGAAIYNVDGEQRGVVGPVGRAWLTGLQGANRFIVKWGANQERQCAFDIDVSGEELKTDEVKKELTCA
ncbi:fimbria/pilus outer membrane usher protein [Achromobacter sp. PAB15]|uniref:fimbria/pilus outer membrane usher protein n=1 Tax=Achromobacter sp. PAB15 TaxID=3233048 RepID=UPI003F917C76